MNIILIGMRGSGKTAVAKILHEKLSIPVIETDKLIEEEVEMDISVYVKKRGWEAFRSIESNVLKKLKKVDNAIISTGGGIVLKKENVYVLKKKGRVFYLKTSVDSLYKRIGKDSKRPALTDKTDPREEMIEVFKKRERLYEDAADEIIETDNLSQKEVAEKIITLISDIYVY